MADAIVQQLSTAADPAEKAAIIAELVFDDLPDDVALVARRCVILHWFDEEIVATLMPGHTRAEAAFVYQQIASLPFIDRIPHGLAYNSLTREGLVRQYAKTRPDILKTSAQLAAASYATRETDYMKAEAFFCYLVAGEQENATRMLADLTKTFKARSDEQSLRGVLKIQEEVEQLPFVKHFANPSIQNISSYIYLSYYLILSILLVRTALIFLSGSIDTTENRLIVLATFMLVIFEFLKAKKYTQLNYIEYTNKKRNRANLFRLIITDFDEGELRKLCFYLGIDYENLPGQTRVDKVRELVYYMDRHGRITELEDRINYLRLTIDWTNNEKSTPSEGDAVDQQSKGSVNIAEFYRLLTAHFNISKLKDICVDIGIDYESLPGQSMQNKTWELLMYMYRHERIADLIGAVQNLRAEDDWSAVQQPILPERLHTKNELLKHIDDTNKKIDKSNLPRFIKPDWIDDTNKKIDKSNLPRFIITHFNEGELHRLCFYLGIDYGNLPGQTRVDKVRELVYYMDRHGRITELEDRIDYLRPNI